MQPKRSHPSQFEQPMSAFRVRPDWYEEYWLRPKQASPSGARRLLRNVALYSILYAAILLVLVSFIRAEPNQRAFDAAVDAASVDSVAHLGARR